MTTFLNRAADPGFADHLLRWYRRQGRDLPWRRSRAPYPVWVSEIMLQQTGVLTVIPYYERFLDRFPDLFSLASADLAEVIELWAGLGYYSRARNLHAAAQILVAREGGKFPEELSELMRLPGIGRSTAGAILAIAFDKRGLILDGNVRRILCRVFALEAPPRSTESERQLWMWAEELTPHDNLHDYSQAIMDLGAMVCTPKKPDCESCPVSFCCLAHYLGKTEDLPLPSTKKAVPTVRQAALVLNRGGSLLLRKRPYTGLLGGLWEFPNIALREGEESCKAAQGLLEQLGLRGELRHRGEIRHTYSHFRLVAEILAGEVSPQAETIMEQRGEERWLSAQSVASIALHGAHRKIMEQLNRRGDFLPLSEPEPLHG